MVETPETIRVEIDQRRHAIARDVDTIEERARSLTDWRQHVEDRPLTMVAVAFGGGVLLGTLLTSPSSSDDDDERERHQPQGLWEASAATHNGAQRASFSPETPRKRAARDSGLADRIDMLRGALMSLAVTKAETYLRDLLPGFTDEAEKQQQKRGLTSAGPGGMASRTSLQTGVDGDPWHERPANTQPASHVGDPMNSNLT